MEPTLLLGQEVLVSSIPYLFSKPKVGDIVVMKYYQLRHSGSSRISTSSRLRGAGDSGVVPLSGTPQNDEKNNKYLVKRIFKIDQDKYFVKGDNEKDSLDSREFGWVERKEIVGKVIYCLSS